MNNNIFHLSLPCKNLSVSRRFYTNELGLNLGRTATGWFDVNFFGNQITFTKDVKTKIESVNYNFDGVLLPAFHCGVIVENKEWLSLKDKLKDKPYYSEPNHPFLDEKIGEHQSFFIKDPNGYSIEFKTFTNSKHIFETS